MKYDEYVERWHRYLHNPVPNITYVMDHPARLMVLYMVVDQGGGLPIQAYAKQQMWPYTSAMVCVYDRKTTPPPNHTWKRMSRSVIPPHDYALAIHHPQVVKQFLKIVEEFTSAPEPSVLLLASGFNSLKRYPRLMDLIQASRPYFRSVVVQHGDIGLVMMSGEEWKRYEEMFDYIWFVSPEKLYHTHLRYKYEPAEHKYIPDIQTVNPALRLMEREWVPLEERPWLNAWLSGVFLWRHPFDYYNFVDEKWVPHLRIVSHARKEFHPSFNIGRIYYEETFRRFPHYFRTNNPRVKSGYLVQGGTTYTTPDKLDYFQFRSILWKSSKDSNGRGCLQIDGTPFEAIVAGTLVVTDKRFGFNPIWGFFPVWDSAIGKSVLLETDGVSDFEAVLEMLSHPTGMKIVGEVLKTIREKFGHQIQLNAISVEYLLRAVYGEPINLEIDEEAMKKYCWELFQKRKKRRKEKNNEQECCPEEE